jgi:AcrR family transcriptional regulator
MTTADEHLTRDERRRRSEAAILQAARELFAESGFERTTIRAVAARAGLDPALVMQHYGSKEGLFAAAARWSDDAQSVLVATRETMPAAAVADLLAKFEDAPDREAAVALMRNCLTHPQAARVMRDEVMCDRAAAVARTLDGEDAELRAGLLGACMIGLGMARYLLEIEPVASASREDLHRLMEPVLRALVDPPA